MTENFLLRSFSYFNFFLPKFDLKRYAKKLNSNTKLMAYKMEYFAVAFLLVFLLLTADLTDLVVEMAVGLLFMHA